MAIGKRKGSAKMLLISRLSWDGDTPAVLLATSIGGTHAVSSSEPALRVPGTKNNKPRQAKGGRSERRAYCVKHGDGSAESVLIGT